MSSWAPRRGLRNRRCQWYNLATIWGWAGWPQSFDGVPLQGEYRRWGKMLHRPEWSVCSKTSGWVGGEQDLTLSLGLPGGQHLGCGSAGLWSPWMKSTVQPVSLLPGLLSTRSLWRGPASPPDCFSPRHRGNHSRWLLNTHPANQPRQESVAFKKAEEKERNKDTGMKKQRRWIHCIHWYNISVYCQIHWTPASIHNLSNLSTLPC